MDKISNKKDKKKKIDSISESICNLESIATLQKEQGDKKSYDLTLKVINCLKAKIGKIKSM